jgi:heme-degrading monooxygenase HmoA
MPFTSVTRLRIRSIRFLPLFALYAQRSLSQARAATGFQEGSLLVDRRWVFWTLTIWETEESMRSYMLSGAHKIAMPRLLDWCDEASVVHWQASDPGLPDWQEAEERMRRDGRPSKLRSPSASHATLQFAPRRPFATNAIQPK